MAYAFWRHAGVKTFRLLTHVRVFVVVVFDWIVTVVIPSSVVVVITTCFRVFACESSATSVFESVLRFCV